MEKVTCKRCGSKINSFSPMRKWCVDCRKVISLEQAKARKHGKDWSLKLDKKKKEDLKFSIRL